jgi:hypothetical protein
MEEVIYVGPSLNALEYFQTLLQDRQMDHVHLVLFDAFAWNATRLDWGRKGAWMTHEQRLMHGES